MIIVGNLEEASGQVAPECGSVPASSRNILVSGTEDMLNGETMSGWVKLHRSFLEWEWYDHPKVKQLFLHCLLRANHKAGSYRGEPISRGEFTTIMSRLSVETGMTVREIRTAIRKLESTGEISVKTTNQFTKISLTNWDKWQCEDPEGQTDDIPKANESQHNKKVKNEKNISAFESEFEDQWDKIKSLNKDHNVKGACKKLWVQLRKKKAEPVDIIGFYRNLCEKAPYAFRQKNIDIDSIADWKDSQVESAQSEEKQYTVADIAAMQARMVARRNSKKEAGE